MYIIISLKVIHKFSSGLLDILVFNSLVYVFTNILYLGLFL